MTDLPDNTIRFFSSLRRPTPVLGLVLTMACIQLAGWTSPLSAQDRGTIPPGWSFLIGEWDLTDLAFDFEGELTNTRSGSGNFSYQLNGDRILELQILGEGDAISRAIHLFAFDPQTDGIEIARTDSDHSGFMILTGTVHGSDLRLTEKHPNPNSAVLRRFTYTKADDDHFSRTLEFSRDGGASFFVRSRWDYSRRE